MMTIKDYLTINKYRNLNLIKIWLLIIVFISIGLFVINKKIRYYEYYQISGEYHDNYLEVYVLTKDLSTITKNHELEIEKEKFAYEVIEISDDNFYENQNYYKKVKLMIKDKKIVNNAIINSHIVVKESSLLGYIFNTIWR